MAENTKKLGLKKPAQTEFYNIDDFNENFQKIDDFAEDVENEFNNHAKTDLSNVDDESFKSKVKSSGANVEVDATLNLDSTNPVQNKVVSAAINSKVSIEEYSGLATPTEATSTSGKRWKGIQVKRGNGAIVNTRIPAYLSDLNLDLFQVEATSTDGKTYTATVEGITELFAGLTLTIIPNKTNVIHNPTFNLNGLGAKSIMVPTNNEGSSLFPDEKFFSVSRPVTITYDGNSWLTSYHRPVADYLTVSNYNAARKNLKVAPEYTYGTTDLIAGTSELATGTLHFVYE